MRADMLRWVCEKVRGAHPLGDEEWESLKRRTVEEGFGRFVEDDERFEIYTPYLEECVEFAPKVADVKALAPFLLDRNESPAHIAHALFFRFSDYRAGEALMRAFLKRRGKNAKRDLAMFLHFRSANDRETVRLLREAIREGTPQETATMEVMLGVSLVTQKGAEAEAENLLRRGVERGFPQCHRELARLYERMPGREKAAEKAFQDAIAARDDDSPLLHLMNDFGVFLTKQERHGEAAAAFRRGCALGDRLACKNLCAAYLTSGVPIEDPAAVVEWFERCAIGDDLEMLGALVALGPPALAKRAYLDAKALNISTGVFPLDVLLSGLHSIEELKGAVAQGSPKLAERAFVRAVEKGQPEALMPLAVLLTAMEAPGRLAGVVSANLKSLSRDILRVLADAIFDLPDGAGLFQLLGDGASLLQPLILGQSARRGPMSSRLHEMADLEWLWPAAEIFLRAAIGLGDRQSRLRLGLLLAQDGSRAAEAEAVYREAIAVGTPATSSALGHLIARNRARWAEAEAVYRQGIKANEQGSYRGLFFILAQTPGRSQDVSRLAQEMVRLGLVELPVARR